MKGFRVESETSVPQADVAIIINNKLTSSGWVVKSKVM